MKKADQLKLYVWRDIFCDYSCGMACVLARDEDHAREIIREQFGTDSWEVRETAGAPICVDEPQAFVSYGGS